MATSPENKEKISISIDAELLRRLDAVCEARGQSRSAVFERIVRNEIDGEEKFLDYMEKPINRALMTVIMKTPGVLDAIATLVGEHLTPENVVEIKELAGVQVQRGSERQKSKKKS